MYYDCLGGNQYRVTVKVYRDCFSDGAEYDDPLPVTIFDGNNLNIGGFDIPFPGSATLNVNFNNNPCVTIPNDICIEEAIYSVVVNLPGSASGYTLAYQRCCRGPDVTNLNTPENQGLTLTVDIPANNLAICNNSPRFNNYPPLLLCANEELVFDHSATDPDGDEIIYELCTPYQGGSDLLPAPDPVPSPPYDPVVWINGSSAINPFGSGTIELNSSTGLLTATPLIAGLYVVGICAKEYRNGVLIGTTRRDFLFKVMNCEITMAASITPQEEMTTFVSYCQGLAIEFENGSYGGTNYAWDFGVDGISSDVSSTFEPTYTYPIPGVYDVVLIVNPGWPCTDTSLMTFIINEEVTANFTAPENQCIVNNSFDFTGEGLIPPIGSTFIWTFGNIGDSNPNSSTSQNPSNILFSQSGSIPITFTINHDVCEVSHTENIFVYAEPTIDYSVSEELKCAPYTAQFIDGSFAHTPIYYIWQYGDGSDFSPQQNPTHIYQNPGVYDVTLTIRTDSGCIDTLTLLKSNYIEVFPSPISEFIISPEEADVFNPHFYFTDLSSGGVDHMYYFLDGNSTGDRFVWHSYIESGFHTPYQVVINEFGCPDTSYQTIYVIPITTVFVPNAFTPDGSNLNEVWQPVIYDTENYNLWVYTRWGEQIFYSNDQHAFWNGLTSSGDLAPTGIYVYKITYIDHDTQIEEEVIGHFSLIK